MKDLYRGTLVRLGAASPEVSAKAFANWRRDTEFHRLVNSEPAQLWSDKKIKEFVERNLEPNSTTFAFSIYTLAEDQYIGSVSLRVSTWMDRDAWLGIMIGDRDYWGKGYGTDAMRLIVQYGFLELNLRRISLGLYDYNERAFKSYQKVGFRMEGRMRGEGFRDGVRYDSLWMGILREEWFVQKETQ